MILLKPPVYRAIIFAYWPKVTPDGIVWLEYVRRELCDGWTYTRLKSEEDYNR